MIDKLHGSRLPLNLNLQVLRSLISPSDDGQIEVRIELATSMQNRRSSKNDFGPIFVMCMQPRPRTRVFIHMSLYIFFEYLPYHLSNSTFRAISTIK